MYMVNNSNVRYHSVSGQPSWRFLGLFANAIFQLAVGHCTLKPSRACAHAVRLPLALALHAIALVLSYRKHTITFLKEISFTIR